MDPASTNAKRQTDAEINQHILQWQQRHPHFLREHKAELRETGADFFGRLLHEHLLFRGKSAYDSLLQTMLSPDERDRLHTDAKFTQAWQIFVDLCWLKKRMKLAGLLIGIIVLCLAALVILVLSMPDLIGPRSR